MRLGSNRAIDEIWFSVAKPEECPPDACPEHGGNQAKTQVGDPPDCPCECPDDACPKEDPNKTKVNPDDCSCECPDEPVCQDPQTKNEDCVCECPENTPTEAECVEQFGAGSTLNQDECKCNCPQMLKRKSRPLPMLWFRPSIILLEEVPSILPLWISIAYS